MKTIEFHFPLAFRTECKSEQFHESFSNIPKCLLHQSNCIIRGKTQAAKDIAGRYPVSQHWDPAESKLFVCEAWNLTRSTADQNQINKPSLTKIVDEGPVSIFCDGIFFCFSSFKTGVINSPSGVNDDA